MLQIGNWGIAIDEKKGAGLTEAQIDKICEAMGEIDFISIAYQFLSKHGLAELVKIREIG